jgi:chemotaxis protein CheY-P-specific phosphatase CheC
MELTEAEHDIAREVVNIAIAKAADMLSFFLKQKVLAVSSNISFDNFEADTKFTEFTSSPVTILKTEVRGEFTGNCYLLLSAEQKEIILKLTLPPLAYRDEKQKKIQGKGILLEIDNIIAASVISQFANLLNFQMYGYVPKLTELNSEEVNTHLYNENSNQTVLLRIKTKLTNSGSDGKIEPEFLWFLNKEVFISGVRKLSK